MSRRLLEEQNAEYEASLAADREREAHRQELQRQAEEEERQRALQEARDRYACISCCFQMAGLLP